MERLTYKTCSNCANWSHYKQVVDEVLAAGCGAQAVLNKNLGMSPKITKGSDSCSKWGHK